MKKICLLNTMIAVAIFSKTYAQDTIATKQNKRVITLGLNSGVTFLNEPFLKGKSTLCCQAYTKGMYLRRYINQYIALEASISFSGSLAPAAIGTISNSSLTIPVTAQYYLFPKRSCGHM